MKRKADERNMPAELLGMVSELRGRELKLAADVEMWREWACELMQVNANLEAELEGVWERVEGLQDERDMWSTLYQARRKQDEQLPAPEPRPRTKAQLRAKIDRKLGINPT